MISPDVKAAVMRLERGRSGFFDDPDAIRSLVAMASFTPAAPAPPSPAAFKGGGSFGSEGATGSSQ